MSDETQQPALEPTQPEPISTPPVEKPISEQNPVPVSPDEPTAEASISPIESVPAPEPSEPTEATPSPESALPVKDQNPANEPFDEAQGKQSEPASEPLENPNISVEKRGNDVTITEVMKPEPEPKTETAQMAQHSSETTAGEQETAHLPPNEPLGETQNEQRKENMKLANQTRQNKKREKIEKILSLFSKNPEITNDEVEKLLHVSDATATRYLETLEKEGKIKQVGKTGKGVSYTKI